MIGRKLSHFRILDRIGEGGMGVVYRAEDEKLRRVVALKLLPPELLADEERRLRFVREARTAAAVTHPNIAVVHEIDEVDGVVFMAMEFIQGKTLRAAIGGKPMILREALRLGLEIAEGLSAAHHARVMHRDLKPDNILVTPDGRVKILDFGLAKLLEEPRQADPEEASKLATISDEMTQAGRVLGTAAYMSPEQARGVPVDARSDLFSFGIVLYEMVTGAPPFRGATSMDVMSAILQKEAPRPSQVNAEVPGELERIIGKCLEKEPGERYQDTRDLVLDLRKLKRDTESGAMTQADRGSPAAFRRPRRLVWAGAAASVLFVAIVAGWLMFRGRPSEPKASPVAEVRKLSTVSSVLAQPDVASVAVLPFANMSGDPDNEYFADGLAEELINVLAKVRGLRIIARTSSFQFKGKNEDVRVIGRKLNVGAILEGSVRKSEDRVRITAQLLNAGDGFHLWSETYDRKLGDIFAVQDEIARSVAGALKVTLLPGEGSDRKMGTSNIEAYDAYLRGRALALRGGVAELEASVREYQRSLALDPGFALAWVGLGFSYYWQAEVRVVRPEDQLNQLREGRRRAREALDHALSLDEDLPEARAIAAFLQVTEDWDFARADEEAQRALALAPGSVEIVLAAGWSSLTWGRCEELQALTVRLTQLDPLNNTFKSYRGAALIGLGRWDEAESTLREVVGLDPALELPHVHLGTLLLVRGRPQEALEEAGRLSSMPSWRLSIEAAAQHALGRKADSDRALNELIEKGSLVWAYQIAEVYAFRGEADRAFQWLERARAQEDGGLRSLKLDPLLEKIREDARYAAFLRKMRLAS